MVDRMGVSIVKGHKRLDFLGQPIRSDYLRDVMNESSIKNIEDIDIPEDRVEILNSRN